MNFKSDNTAPAAPEVLAALARVNDGAAGNYGDDNVTDRLKTKLSALFEKEVAVFPVATGTAANALSLATLTPPHGAIFCHEGAHIHVDECGAPEFYSQGAKLVPLEGAHGKLTPEAIKAALAHHQRGVVHHAQPSTISLTQATELGTVYKPGEIEALARFARHEQLTLHMDGARFANAIAHLKCSPAEATWKAGVDALSMGFTKNGAMAAEAVIFFNPAHATDIAYRRKRAGHLFSKMRYLSTQIEAMLDGGLWLKLAGHANAMATRLAEGLRSVKNVALEHPVEANELFVRLPSIAAMQTLEAAGAKFYEWEPPAEGRPLIRLVCSFSTTPSEIDAFLAAARKVG
ncbi:MAG: low specificity L-threonine aldolase [Alphaproteobacteria bacterium]|nr:low specificity L-threonine aldolase [Alphaproteobacteria bacterium]